MHFSVKPLTNIPQILVSSVQKITAHEHLEAFNDPLPYQRKHMTWQNDTDIYHYARRTMITRISNILQRNVLSGNTTIPYDGKDHSKLMNDARTFELHLYESASSFAEYNDNTTLKDRLNEVHKKILELKHQEKMGKRKQQAYAQKLQDKANRLAAEGHYFAACETYEHSLNMLHRAFGEDATNDFIARTLHVLGIVEHRLGKFIEARAHCETALDMYYRLYGMDGNGNHINMVRALELLGKIARKLGNRQASKNYYMRASYIKMSHEKRANHMLSRNDESPRLSIEL